MRYRYLVILTLALIAVAPLALAQDSPRRGAVLQRIEARLDALDLTPDQQEKADQILAEASRKLAALREDADLASLRDASAEIFRDLRIQLAGVLTATQLRQFEESMPRRLRNDERPAEPSPMTEGGMSGMTDTGSGMDETKNPEKPVPNSPSAPSTPAETAAGAPSLFDERFAPGTPAPGFTLNDLNNKPVALNRLRGKPTVLVFGSFTSPTFRDKIGAFEALKKEYRNKVNFIVIYTREAYPNNEWEVQRNIDEQIRVGQHVTLDERRKLAKMTADGMRTSMDVLVDDMDDGVATAYDAMPNGCVIIDGQGRIVRKQKWADAHAARLAIDEALRSR